MRCSRCDRPAVPQALGRDGDGRLVFGWCLDCLHAAGCSEIEVARGAGSDPRHLPPLFLAHIPARPDATRRRGVRIVALVLTLWSVLLFTGGAWAIWANSARPPSPMGNGTPLFLFAGAVSTALTALLLRGCAARDLEPPC